MDLSDRIDRLEKAVYLLLRYHLKNERPTSNEAALRDIHNELVDHDPILSIR